MLGLSYEWWIVILLVIIIDTALLWYVMVYRFKKKLPQQQRKYYLRLWSELQMKSHKEAVMEADKILDKLLGHKGYEGSLGDKLKKANGVFTDLNGVWEAHKLRNKLAHELDFSVSQDTYKRAMKSFERAFKDLGLFS